MATQWRTRAIGLFCVFASSVLGQDMLGLANGYINLTTTNFNARIVHDAQVLASLKIAGSTFDFMPFDFLPDRARNGQYHWGDITLRYRTVGATAWTSVDSSTARKPVTAVSTGALAASLMTPTLPTTLPLNITREWINVSGDLGLRFTIVNKGTTAIELGSLGFPTEFNNIFSNRTAPQIQQLCSLEDPYIGMDAGYIRVTPVSGTGSALVVTPIGSTPMEAYRNLVETPFDPTDYGSQTFEGLYEWQVHTEAWAQNEWAATQPWNVPTSQILQPGQSVQYGLRFSAAKGDIRQIEPTVKSTGTPFAVGIPGHIIPTDLTAQLLLFYSAAVSNIAVSPAGALTLTKVSTTTYNVVPSTSAWGRVRVTITYADGKIQTVHYYVIKPATQAIGDLGNFLTTAQWFTNTSDPFGRAFSVMSYDWSVQAIVTQEMRAWIAGLSDEGGAGSFLAATMKQAAQPNAAEITKLEQFVDAVLWKTIQTPDYGVRKSIFYYQPALVPNYNYNPNIDWTTWESWNQASAYAETRAYDFVHVAAAYWALYRASRAYPTLFKSHTWDWYLNQSYHTVIRCMETDSRGNLLVGNAGDGLMGETVFGELLSDLGREGLTTEANAVQAAMKTRATLWNSEAVPFGSEMPWDSTGQEGVYYWTKFFGFTASATKALNTVLGYTPTVAHWGWNGNARRYWDNIYAGKLERYERQIHHYGSGLNALTLLSAFRSNTSDAYLARVGYAGMNGPLSNINTAGFASASFHSFPNTLAWDAYSGDYGPNFSGLILGAATYVVQDPDAGLVAYGGMLTTSGTTSTVQTRDAVRRKVFIGPLGVLISIDAGIIQQFTFNPSTKAITVTLSQLAGVPTAAAAVMWLETDSGTTTFAVTTPGLAQVRKGWQIPLTASTVTVQIGPQ